MPNRNALLCLCCAGATAAFAAGFDVDAETRRVVEMETGKPMARTSVSRERLAEMVAAVPSKPRLDVRSLPRTGRRECWVENGHLVLDGRPILRRNMYAMGYGCSKAFLDRVKSDNIFDTAEFTKCGIEFGRLVPGSEAREGKRHQKPSQEVFGAIARKMDSMKGKDFAFYYLCDEPECRSISPVYLKWLYEFVKERDPYHAVFICSRDAMKYIECADCIEVHPYIDPFVGTDGRRHYGTPINTFGNYIEEAVALGRKDKVIGCTPTAFAYDFKGFRHDYPTFDEYVASVWTILAGGGKSIYPFLGGGMGGRPCIYEGVKYVFSSAEALEEMLLAGKRRRIERTDEYETAEWELDGERMFVAVNLCGRELKGVKVRGVNGRFVEFRGERKFGGASLSGGADIVLDLKPFEVVVATTKIMDEGYEPLADVKARVRKLEYDRTHRDNQLFGKVPELQFAASKPLGFQTKIADGMIEQRAELLRGRNPWYEVSFPDGPLTFDRILIYGENIGNVTVKVRKAGKWVGLEPAGKIRKGYAVDMSFEENVRTCRIRFEFHRDNVDLYEIEIPRPKSVFAPPEPMPKRRDAVRGYALEGQSYFVLDASNAVRDGRPAWRSNGGAGKDVNVRVSPDGDFSVGPSGGFHPVRLNPKWRWAEVLVSGEARHPNERGYAMWQLSILKHQNLAGSVRSCQAGLYTIPLKAVEKEKHASVRLWNLNTDIPLRYIRLCERPPCFLSVTNPEAAKKGCIAAGDTLRFELALDEPCEDVVLTYYTFHDNGTGPIPFSLDGQGGAELERRDGKGMLWRADVKAKSAVKPSRSAIYAKAVVLGGARRQVIHTKFPLDVRK